MRDSFQGVIDELRAESMRAATVVGLASIPVGFLAIYLLGSQTGVVFVATGIIVGVLYSDRPTPAHRAGARAGIFTPIPTLLVQGSRNVLNVWELSASVEVRVAAIALGIPLLVFGAWVIFTFVVIGIAYCTGWIVGQVRPYLSNSAGSRA